MHTTHTKDGGGGNEGPAPIFSFITGAICYVSHDDVVVPVNSNNNSSHAHNGDSSNQSTLDHAQSYRRAGFSVLPIKRGANKKPSINTWRKLMLRQTTEKEIDIWFGDEAGRPGVGIAGGTSKRQPASPRFRVRRLF